VRRLTTFSQRQFVNKMFFYILLKGAVGVNFKPIASNLKFQ
jgi:hypothetical protein